jgi:hypothetical protein
MSLLNTTNDGLHNVLVALCGTLLLEKRKALESELLQKTAPAAIVHEQGKMVRQTLNRWVELGLLLREDDSISLSPDYWPAGKVTQDELASTVRRATRTCALAPVNNANLWAKESAKSADLTRSLCLLLAQDVYRTTFSQLETLENEQVVNAELRLVQNDTRINGLKKWSHFLGFVRQGSAEDIDPTIAVRDSIRDWMRPGEKMPTSHFLAHLGEALPVLDGGVYRNAVEQELDRTMLFVPGPGQVSSSLSRALLGLRASGDLAWDSLSDAVGEGLTLTGRDGPRPEFRFTHLWRPEESK